MSEIAVRADVPFRGANELSGQSGKGTGGSVIGKIEGRRVRCVFLGGGFVEGNG